MTVADSIEELLKIKHYAPEMKVLWRIATDKPDAQLKIGSFSAKFGDQLVTEEQIHRRLKQIQALGVKLEGVAFHTGSNFKGSGENLEYALNLSRQLIRIGREYAHPMRLLDIGGGFPALEIADKYLEILRSTQNDPLGYEVVAEPGRHSVGNCYSILTRIIGKREVNGKHGYFINESQYHSFNNVVMDSMSLDEAADSFYSSVADDGTISTDFEKDQRILFGMTCCGSDVITTIRPPANFLPPDNTH